MLNFVRNPNFYQLKKIFLETARVNSLTKEKRYKIKEQCSDLRYNFLTLPSSNSNGKIYTKSKINFNGSSFKPEIKLNNKVSYLQKTKNQIVNNNKIYIKRSKSINILDLRFNSLLKTQRLKINQNNFTQQNDKLSVPSESQNSNKLEKIYTPKNFLNDMKEVKKCRKQTSIMKSSKTSGCTVFIKPELLETNKNFK